METDLFVYFLNIIVLWMLNQPCNARINFSWTQWIILFLLKEVAFGFVGFIIFPLCGLFFSSSLISSQLLLFSIFYLVVIGFCFSRFFKFTVYIFNISTFVQMITCYIHYRKKILTIVILLILFFQPMSHWFDTFHFYIYYKC